MVYNPDWMWHKITSKRKNPMKHSFFFLTCLICLFISLIIDYGGLSIGVPIRETNISITFQNNKFFTSVVMLNKILNQVGLSLGGYPPPSFQTEADN
jgi:hypothetical protein